MNAAAGRLAQAILVTILLAGLATLALQQAAAPRLLLIDPGLWNAIALRAALLSLGCIVAALLVVHLILRKFRFTLRALSLGSLTVEPEELDALDRAPARVSITATLILIAGQLGLILPGFLPPAVDADTCVSLTLFSITLFATAALPLYVLVRRRFARAMELGPPDAMRELMERYRFVRRPQRRMIWRVAFAVVSPVGLVGVGVTLLEHAHIRAFEARERMETAMAIAECALEPVPGAVPTAGERDAATAATRSGFWVRLYSQPARYEVQERPDGRMLLVVPIGAGHARIVFDENTVLALSTWIIVVASFATILALILGAVVARSVVDDLLLATRQVQLLGTEIARRGVVNVARPARYAVVAELGTAIEQLAHRFGVFAATQEQAIEAREAARRMRGLLFASMSHDLKGTLNSVLGFADLVDTNPLAPAQRESLQLIQRRGRELLALVQTVLDAARVEAGQLVLHTEAVKLGLIVSSAAGVARELTGAEADRIEIAQESPAGDVLVRADTDRIVDALGALIRHCVRTTRRGQIRVGTSVDPASEFAIVSIYSPTRTIAAAALARLMLPDGENTVPHIAGGLALGLSLARSLLVLHDGMLEVADTAEGVVFRAFIPCA